MIKEIKENEKEESDEFVAEALEVLEWSDILLMYYYNEKCYIDFF